MHQPSHHRRIQLPKPTLWAHTAIQQILRPGEVAVDATVGNGHDTLFLAETVGSEGHVYGFDLQTQALQNTRARLEQSGIPLARVSLFQASHASLAQHLPPSLSHQGVRAITFNLGYLPGSDKSFTTLQESTILALNAARPYLAEGGLLSVVAYPGHPAGQIEAEAVSDWMHSLAPTEFEVQHLRSPSHHRSPPELWLALKLR